MKNQYFGDVRDLFKYDVITQVMKGVDHLLQFSFIPMLTPNDERNDGNERDFSKAKAGFKNQRLVNSLKPIHKLPKEKRDFRVIGKYFTSENIKIKIYDHEKGSYFNHKERREYFRNIKHDLLKRALVFMDPDKGLEIKISNEKHILYSEVKDIYNMIDRYSIIMIFQFFPREEHNPYIHRRLSEIKELTANITYVSDNKILFLFLGKDKKLLGSLKTVLKRYINDYRDCYFE